MATRPQLIIGVPILGTLRMTDTRAERAWFQKTNGFRAQSHEEAARQAAHMERTGPLPEIRGRLIISSLMTIRSKFNAKK